MTRSPRFEGVLGPLTAAIIRHLTAREEATVREVVDGLQHRRRATYRSTTRYEAVFDRTFGRPSR